MPNQTFSHRATASAPVDQVWSALDRPETWEAIGGVDTVFDPVIDDRGRLRGFSFDTNAAGKRYVGVATPQVRAEGERMSWKIENSEVSGITSVELTPGDHGTIVEVTIHVESAGLLSTMFFPAIAIAIGRGLPQAVERFAAGLGA